MEPPIADLDFTAYFAAIAAIAATLFAVLAAATQIVKIQQDKKTTHHRQLALLSALGELMAASLASSAMLLPGRLVAGFVDGDSWVCCSRRP